MESFLYLQMYCLSTPLHDPELLYAIKEKVDNSIICKTRDGSISRIKIEGTLVNFLLPFKDTKKIYNDSKEE
jgi:hypothetical protein